MEENTLVVDLLALNQSLRRYLPGLGHLVKCQELESKDWYFIVRLTPRLLVFAAFELNSTLEFNQLILSSAISVSQTSDQELPQFDHWSDHASELNYWMKLQELNYTDLALEVYKHLVYSVSYLGLGQVFNRGELQRQFFREELAWIG